MPLDQPEEEKEMSFLDHLEELRWHLVRIVIAVLIGAVIAFIYDEILFDKIIFAPKDPNFITYRVFCKIGQFFGVNGLCIQEIPIQIINMNMGGQFNMHMWASLIAGVILAFPFIIYELWSFLKPALYAHEKKSAGGLLIYTGILFALGVAFGYFVLSALTINFLGNYQISSGNIANNINISSYISSITMVTLATGILFELPIVIYFLTKIGMVTPAFLRKYRRHALILNLALSAIITPPDIISQIIIAMPLTVLYELGIWVSARAIKGIEKEKSEALVKK